MTVRASYFLFLILITTIGCSLLKASEAPTTPFLRHASELKEKPERMPWQAVWSSNPGGIVVLLPETRKIYLMPINIHYLNIKQNEQGKWIHGREIDAEDVTHITDLKREKFLMELGKTATTHLEIVEAPEESTIILEIALTELSPTEVAVNSVANVGSLLVPGAKIVQNAVAVGGPAAGGAIAAGSIAIEMKFTDGKTGKILAEAKDRQTDPASILPNYRDFEQYGWSRHTIKAWADLLGEIFSTPASKKIEGESNISIVPW